MKPMLAESAKIEELDRYIQDDGWVFEQKFDGQRHLVIVHDGAVSAIGRNGQAKVTNLRSAVLAEFGEGFPSGDWIFDGELVNGVLHLFDLPQAGTLVTPESPFQRRRNALELLFEEWKPNPSRICLVPCAWGPAGKAELFEKARAGGAEGLMLKALDGRYSPGKRTSRMLKAKFHKEADCIILRLHEEGKENAVIGLLDPAGNRVVELGTVSTIGKRPIPAAGQIWEVRFLYATDGPKLYQPRLVRCRDTEKAMHECTIDQLDSAYTDKSFVYRTRRSM